MGCGSIHELDNHVQECIWREILCGPAPHVESSSDSESESFLGKYHACQPEPGAPWMFQALEVLDAGDMGSITDFGSTIQ